MRVQKFLAMTLIAKCFGAAGAGHGKSPCNISKSQALFDGSAANELVDEAGVETVSSADSIDELTLLGRCLKNFFAAARDGPLRSALDHH